MTNILINKDFSSHPMKKGDETRKKQENQIALMRK